MSENYQRCDSCGHLCVAFDGKFWHAIVEKNRIELKRWCPINGCSCSFEHATEKVKKP